MASYLLIESRDPFESNGFAQRCELATALAAAGAAVTVFFVENGALAARSTVLAHELDKLRRAGVSVLVDEFALRERGMALADLAPPVKSRPLSELVDRLGAGARALWN